MEKSTLQALANALNELENISALPQVVENLEKAKVLLYDVMQKTALDWGNQSARIVKGLRK